MSISSLEKMSIGELLDVINQKVYLFPKKERQEVKSSDIPELLKRGDNDGN